MSACDYFFFFLTKNIILACCLTELCSNKQNVRQPSLRVSEEQTCMFIVLAVLEAERVFCDFRKQLPD